MEKFESLNFNRFNDFVVFLDVDGTIVAHGQENYTQKVNEKIKSLKKNNRVYICSNNRNIDRNQKLSEKLDLPIINKQYKKPDKKILAFLNNSEKKKSRLVIGDKLYPDKLFARKIQADFIQVERILSGRENWLIRCSYWLDKMVKFFFE